MTSIDAEESNAPRKASKKARNYSEKTLKILFALSGNRCAHPECPQSIIESATEHSTDFVAGHISHIYAHSDDGPRGRPGMSNDERNQPDNLLLLCPTHHAIVDGQHETYPADLLHKWKQQHERKYRESLSAKLTDIGAAELETAARALLAPNVVSNGDYTIVSPEEKIRKNALGVTSRVLITLGAAKAREVEKVLLNAEQLDARFPDRLRAGFVTKYSELRKEGLLGDDLFLAMYEWCGGGGKDKAREVSGLCILTHLFVICEVFEK